MCAEYERVERVVQNDVWPEERDPGHSVYSSTSAEPDEARMVKKFRRAAAGLEEQLPSDLRPPSVLKRTCDYLFDEVVGNAPKLEKVHHFVWDRTRAIRNDFSIQQLTKAEDLRLAMDCYERIARFHILSLHQLAVSPKPYDKYDAQQEREQLDRTLLSLMQYYEDSRGRVELPNEAEFRAYCVIFQLQDPTPDLEDRVQTWPRHIVLDRRIQTALDLYAAACNTMDSQGPLKPRASHVIAQQDWQRFWTLIDSKQVSYLMGCVAEIYFNLVRRTVLNAIFRSFKANPTRSPEDWTVGALCDVLAFDEEIQVYIFCKCYGFSFAARTDGEEYLDLTSVKEKSLPQPMVGLPKQWKSEIVESKRYGRTLPAVINGLAVRQAQQAGMVDEEDREEGMDDVTVDHAPSQQRPGQPFMEDDDPTDDTDSLFVTEQSKSQDGASTPQSLTNGLESTAKASTTTFGTGSSGFSFGQPSGVGFGQPSGVNSIFSAKMAGGADSQVSNEKKPFDFASVKSQSRPTGSESVSVPIQATGPSLPKFEPSTFSFKAEPSPKSKSAESQQQPTFGPPSGDQNSDFLQAAPKANSGETAPLPSFQWPAPGASVTASQETAIPETKAGTSYIETYKQPSVESAPTSPEEIFTFGQVAAATGTTSPASHVTKPETKHSQPHFTASNPAVSTGLSNGAASSNSVGRKPSLNHQPRKPSPLSKSFSVEGVNDPTAASESFGKAAGKQPVKELFPGREDQAAHKAFTETKTPEASRVPNSPKTDFVSIITRLANEITNDEVSGFLSQYVEFIVQQAITSAQEQVNLEKSIAKADKFRETVLYHRYFKRWKDTFWGRKFAKRGSRRRERARKGLEESRRSQGSDSNSFLGNSRAASAVESAVDDIENHRQMVDSMFQQTVKGGRSGGAPAEHQAKVGSKRPLSSHGANASSTSRGLGHKRMKSTSHVDDSGRVSKPAPTSNPNADILKRSSFLGFKMPTIPLDRGSTTRSNYFRLKAMGVNPVEQAHGTKRPRDESLEVTPKASPPALRTATFLKSSFRKPHDNALMRSPSSAPTTRNDADEALFARLKAARESLVEGSDYMKTEVAKEEELRRSLSASQSSNESPSMARASAEAKWRASHPKSTFGTSDAAGDVPAYRLRESKFVPREQYGKAVERAKEIVESRSRDTSRRQSDVGQDTPHLATSLADQYPQQYTSAFASQHTTNGLHSQLPKSPDGLPSYGQTQMQFPSTVPDSVPFTGAVQQPAWTFTNASSQAFESKKPFMQSTASNTFSSFASQPAFGAQAKSSQPGDVHDFTIQPSQVQQSLSNSFGASQSQGFGQPSQGFGPQSFQGFSQHSPTPPQPDSYMFTQSATDAIGLLSDDEDDTQPAYATQMAQEPAINGNQTDDGSDELIDHAADEEAEDSYDYNNPYAALANDMGGDTEEDADEGHTGQDFQSQFDKEFEDEQQGPNGYDFDQEGGYGDEGLDGDIEDAEDYDDEGIQDDDETEVGSYSMHQHFTNGNDYEEETDEDVGPTRRVLNPQLPKNEALQGVGGTQEEAIELSD